MSSPELLGELRMAQDLVTALAEQLDETGFRQQFHSEPSPLGWHLGHCTYTECYWLQEIIQQNNRFTRPVSTLYTPPLTPKPERGRKIPAPEVMQQWVFELQSMNHETLAAPGTSKHPLMQNDYLLHFLIQHYSQHYENMLMILPQQALSGTVPDHPVEHPLPVKQPAAETISIQAGYYRVGGKSPLAYDNELPAQETTLGPYRITRKPVCNSEFVTS